MPQVGKSHADRTYRHLHDIHRACCLHGFLQASERERKPLRYGPVQLSVNLLSPCIQWCDHHGRILDDERLLVCRGEFARDDGQGRRCSECLYQEIGKVPEAAPPSLVLAAIGLSASIVTALLLPGKIYEYITTAAGILQMYNWSFIIISAYKILKVKTQDMVLGNRHRSSVGRRNRDDHGKEHPARFFVSLILAAIVAVVTLIMVKVWNRMQTNTINN